MLTTTVPSDLSSDRWSQAHRILRLASTAIQRMLIVAAAFGILTLGAGEFAFRRDTAISVRRAAVLGNSLYYERLAELEPERAREILQEATRIDPRAASVWISLGLREEQGVDTTIVAAASRRTVRENADRRPNGFHAARRAFETAFQIDRQYAPAWALANFCFRQTDQECFWRAASRAVARAPSWAAAQPGAMPNLTDLKPLLYLASRMDNSPERVLDRLESTVSERQSAPHIAPKTFLPARYVTPYATRDTVSAPLERAYLDELIGRDQWSAAEIVARLISSEIKSAEAGGRGVVRDATAGGGQNNSDRARLDDFVDRLIAARRAHEAVDLWNEYAGFAPLDARGGFSLTNGDFERPPKNAGFDWRLGMIPAGPSDRRAGTHRVPGFSNGIEPLWTRSQLEFLFSGEEPEHCQIAEQWLPTGSRAYRLSFDYRSQGLPSSTGIRWELAAAGSPGESPPLPSSAEWTRAQWNWASAEGLARLRLVYRRVPGTARARGSLLVRHVRLEAL